MRGFPGGTAVKNLPANARDTRDAGLILGSGRSPGGGNGNPFQDSCLGNPTDRGAWQATVHGVEKSRTRLRTHTHTHTNRPWCWISFHGLICHLHSFCVCVKYLLSSFVHLKNWVVYFLTVENSNIHIFWIQVFCQICDMQTLSLNWQFVISSLTKSLSQRKRSEFC